MELGLAGPSVTRWTHRLITEGVVTAVRDGRHVHYYPVQDLCGTCASMLAMPGSPVRFFPIFKNLHRKKDLFIYVPVAFPDDGGQQCCMHFPGTKKGYCYLTACKLLRCTIDVIVYNQEIVFLRKKNHVPPMRSPIQPIIHESGLRNTISPTQLSAPVRGTAWE
jgi:hypothetical protein